MCSPYGSDIFWQLTKYVNTKYHWLYLMGTCRLVGFKSRYLYCTVLWMSNEGPFNRYLSVFTINTKKYIHTHKKYPLSKETPTITVVETYISFRTKICTATCSEWNEDSGLGPLCWGKTMEHIESHSPFPPKMRPSNAGNIIFHAPCTFFAPLCAEYFL